MVETKLVYRGVVVRVVEIPPAYERVSESSRELFFAAQSAALVAETDRLEIRLAHLQVRAIDACANHSNSLRHHAATSQIAISRMRAGSTER